MSIVKDLYFVILFVILEIYSIQNLAPVFNHLFLLVLIFACFIRISYLSSELKSEKKYFIDILNHDLKVALIAQFRALDALKESNYSLSDQELIIETKKSISYSIEMLNMLEKAIKYETGEEKLKYSHTNLAKDLDILCLKLENFASEKNLTFNNYIPRNLSIYTDRNSLLKAIEILMDTSIKNSKSKNNIPITARLINNKLKFYISYIGEPLTKTETAKILNKNSHFSTVGHGIQMDLCKKIIKFHGGKIFIRRKTNLNIFELSMPLIRTKPTQNTFMHCFQPINNH